MPYITTKSENLNTLQVSDSQETRDPVLEITSDFQSPSAEATRNVGQGRCLPGLYAVELGFSAGEDAIPIGTEPIGCQHQTCPYRHQVDMRVAYDIKAAFFTFSIHKFLFVIMLR